MRYPLPHDTVGATENVKCKNLGLVLDRFLPIEDDEWDIRRSMKQREGIPAPDSQLTAALRKRHVAALKSLTHAGLVVNEFDATTEYRLVLGFGTEHVLETSLCLHRIHGVPYIPGSAIKGVARAVAFWQVAEQLQIPRASYEVLANSSSPPAPLSLLNSLLSEGSVKKQEAILQQLTQHSLCRNLSTLQNLDLESWASLVEEFRVVFGTTERIGGVTFFDALPADIARLDVDILNPHFAPYYQADGGAAPADYYEPIPTHFLTVAPTTRFHFSLAGRAQECVDRATKYLQSALVELGIGGKTSSGFGFFHIH